MVVSIACACYLLNFCHLYSFINILDAFTTIREHLQQFYFFSTSGRERSQCSRVHGLRTRMGVATVRYTLQTGDTNTIICGVNSYSGREIYMGREIYI